MKKFLICFMVFILTSIDIVNLIAAQASQKKRVYITNFDRKKDISETIAEKIHDNIKITLFEKSGNEYRIISDEDIKVMFKKAESLQAAGCDDENCNLNLAQAINADEIIYGTVSRDAGKIKVVLYNLETGIAKKPGGAGTKSMVNVSFNEKDVEWMSREIALKLINPKYKISKAPHFDDVITIASSELPAIQKTDISAIKFSKNEISFNAILEHFKTIADEGDIYLGNNDYKKARNKYLEIIRSINSRMSAESKQKSKSFKRSIEQRISATFVMEYKTEIEKIDKSILSEKDQSEKRYKNAIDEYYSIAFDIRKMLMDIILDGTVNPDENKVKGKGGERFEILKLLDDRQDLMRSAVISLNEKKGDSEYRSLNFNNALKNYLISKREAELINDEVLRIKKEALLFKKIDIVVSAGRSYLDNMVSSYLDQAEYYNVINESSNGIKSLNKARELITGPLKRYSSMELINRYNYIASMIPGSRSIDEGALLSVKRAMADPTHEITFKDDLHYAASSCIIVVIVIVLMAGIFAEAFGEK